MHDLVTNNENHDTSSVPKVKSVNIEKNNPTRIPENYGLKRENILRIFWNFFEYLFEISFENEGI